MTTIISNNIVTPCTPELLQWCNVNLVLNNPEYARKQKLNLWIGNTPKTISLFEQRDDNLVLPFGTWNSIRKYVHGDIVLDFADKPIKITGSVPLYDYQEIAVQRAIDAGNGIIISAAGSGKTQMGIELIRRIGKKTLWLTHTKDLLVQSRQRAEQYLKCSGGMGNITEGRIIIGDITFATVQTLCKCDLESMRKEFSVVIVDECHRLSHNPTQLTQFGKVINSLACRHKYGLTATAHRADGMIKGMYALLGDVAHCVEASTVADKTIKAYIKRVDTYYKLSRFSPALDVDGTIIFAKLISEIGSDILRNNVMLENINPNASTLVLSDRIGQLQHLQNVLGCGVLVDGKTKKDIREQAIEDMRTGKQKVLFATYKLAKEGLDIPRLQHLHLASPVKDYAIVVQAVGRIERVFGGKKDCTVYDYVDDVGICSAMWNERKRHYKANNNPIL
jgi:superfamily II DNA or RNA helicase